MPNVADSVDKLRKLHRACGMPTTVIEEGDLEFLSEKGSGPNPRIRILRIPS
jgi:hypothetical protein